MNKYVVGFVYLKGVETPCITRKLVRALNKTDAINKIQHNYPVLKLLSIDKQY